MAGHTPEQLFWYRSTPPESGSWEWTKVTLEEGGADDIQPILENPRLAAQVWLSSRVRLLWQHFLKREAEKMNAGEVIGDQHRRVLRVAATVLGSYGYVLSGGTALAACYLYHRKSEDLDLFTTQDDVPAAVREEFVQACRNDGLQVTLDRAWGSGHFTRLWIGDPPIKVELGYNGGFVLEPGTIRLEGMPVASLADLAADKLLTLWDRAAPRDFVDVYFLAREHYDLSQMESLAGQKDLGFVQADRYYWAQALSQAEKIPLDGVEILRPLELNDLRAFFRNAAQRVLSGIRRGDTKNTGNIPTPSDDVPLQ